MFLKKKIVSMISICSVVALSVSGCNSVKSSSVSQTSAPTDAVASASLQKTEETEDSGMEKPQSAETAQLSNLPVQDYIRLEDGNIVVTHKYGETIVPQNPQRILSIKMEDLLLALEVDMVACRNFDDFYLADQINELGIPSIAVDEEANTVNYEEILSYQPDLIIIRDQFEQNIYDELSKIAPVIAFDLKDVVNSTLGIGIALGITDKAEARILEYKEFIDSARVELDEAVGDETVAMLRILKKEIRLYPYSTNNMSSFLYDGYANATDNIVQVGIGLTPPPMSVEFDKLDSYAISMETLPDLTADHIFLVAGYGSNTAESVAEAKKRFEEIESDPIWKTVPAVESGNIYEVDSRLWLTHGMICTEMKIQEVLDQLVK